MKVFFIIRAIQRKGGDINFYLLSVVLGHQIKTLHNAIGGFERSATGILKTFTWLQDGKFPDHPFALHIHNFSIGINNHTIAVIEFHGASTQVFDIHLVGPYIMAFLGRRLIVKKIRSDGYRYTFGGFRIH